MFQEDFFVGKTSQGNISLVKLIEHICNENNFYFQFKGQFLQTFGHIVTICMDGEV